ncbi:MAG TPA: hypothetical protein VGC42_12575 [Kofleriaceae bacterium]
MRCRRALFAGLLLAARHANADPGEPPAPSDVRNVFGLPATRTSAYTAPACDDGLAFDCAVATDPLADATPYALSTWLPGSYLRSLPTADLTHDAVAGYALGAGRDGAGPAFGGATGLDNRWTIDGAPADNLRTGGAETSIPLSFLDGLMVSAGGFSARDRASTGGTIDARLKSGTAQHELTADAYASLTAAQSQRAIPAGSFTLRRLTASDGPRYTASVVATGPLGDLLGGHAWYAAGVAPTLAISKYAWLASRVHDDDHDNIPDGLPGDVVTSPVECTRTRTHDYDIPAMARVGLDAGAHHLDVSLVGEAVRASRFLGNATLQAAGVDRRTLIGDAIATWRGTWPDTRARLQLAWHRSDQHESARDPAAAGIPQVGSAYLPAALPEDPGLVAGCQNDPLTTVAACPVPFGFFYNGGAGQLTDIVGDRPSVTADLAHRFGKHVVRIGTTVEDSRLVTTNRFTGGQQQFTLFTNEQSSHRYYVGDCSEDASASCDYADSSQQTYRTLYAAAYAEDTLSLQPGLQVDAGVRYELMWVGSALHFSEQIAPRVGITWDVLGDGRSRIWVSLGRTYAMLPAGLGSVVTGRDSTVDDFVLDGDKSRGTTSGTASPVPSGTEPIEQDEVTAGAEVALAGALRATLWGQGRFVRRGLETASIGFSNPGLVPGEEPAIREAELVAFQLELAATHAVAIRAGVSWGRAVGTWTGPYDPRQGANLYQGADWNSSNVNLYGTLPSDAGGRMFMELERHGTVGPVGLAVATRLTVASGIPRDVLGDGDGVVQLLPRGAAGRNPLVSQANLRLAASLAGFELRLDVFNLFDQRTVLFTDEVYTDDAVLPIRGGSATDLVQLKNESGNAITRRTSYGLPLSYQAPISATLGLHKAF